MSPKVQKITPCLWLDGRAEEAANHYVSIFPDAKVTDVTRYPEGAPQPAGTVMTVNFRLAGQDFIALNGGPKFTFNEAVSFVVTCADQAEIDAFWEKLSEGGTEIQCGWLKDRYGLCWQVVPAGLDALFQGTPEQSERVMAAMLGMVKLDMGRLREAFEGDTER
jgi:predicted 3-demethylubiquinone-9 3-methyltransferase (glyoxalase superfamily)